MRGNVRNAFSVPLLRLDRRPVRITPPGTKWRHRLPQIVA